MRATTSESAELRIACAYSGTATEYERRIVTDTADYCGAPCYGAVVGTVANPVALYRKARRENECEV